MKTVRSIPHLMTVMPRSGQEKMPNGLIEVWTPLLVLPDATLLPSTASSPWGRCVSSISSGFDGAANHETLPAYHRDWSRYGHVTKADHWCYSLRFTVWGYCFSSGGF